MNRPSLSRSVASNFAGYVIGIAAAFLVSPILIRSLGSGRYGAWTFMAEVFGYYTLLDLGVRSAVSYYVATYHARHEVERLRSSAASAVWAMTVTGILVLTAATVTILQFPHVIPHGTVDTAELIPALMVMGLTLAISLPVEAMTSILVGYQRFDIINSIEVAFRVITSAAIVIAMRGGGGLIELSAIQAAGKACQWGVTLLAIYRVAPELSLHPRWVSRTELRALTRIGSRNLVGHIAGLAINKSSLIIVGMFVGAEAVTYYAIARMLVEYTANANFTVTRVFTPQFTTLFARKEMENLRWLLYKGIRLSGLMCMLSTAGLIAFGQYFIRLWISPTYVTGDWKMRSDVVLLLLIVGQCPRMMQSTSWQLLFASGYVGAAMWINVAEAFTNVFLSMILVQYFQIAGVALGNMVPVLLSSCIVIPWYVSKRFQVPGREVMKYALGKPLVVGLVLFAVTQILVRALPPTTWALLAAEVAVTCAAAAVLSFCVGLTLEERAAILGKVRTMAARGKPVTAQTPSR